MWKYSLSSEKFRFQSMEGNNESIDFTGDEGEREGNKNACIYAWNLSEFERVLDPSALDRQNDSRGGLRNSGLGQAGKRHGRKSLINLQTKANAVRRGGWGLYDTQSFSKKFLNCERKGKGGKSR